MKRSVNYFGLAFLFVFLLGSTALVAQDEPEVEGTEEDTTKQSETVYRLYKADVQPKRERLPNIINKLLYDEYAPAISPDGNTLVYQSNESGKSWKKFRLWESRRNERGFWTEPKEIEAVNSEFDEGQEIGGANISYDGSTLFFHVVMDDGNGDIYAATRKKDEEGVWGDWESPAKVSGAINSEDSEMFPSVASDGAKMYYTSYNAENDTTKTNRKGTKCYKLMVSTKDLNGNWGKGEELPEPVNGMCDKYVRVMPDNQSIFFSSTRTGGSPKNSDDFDLYYTELQPGNEWTEPKPTDISPLVKSTLYSYQPDMLISIAPHDKPHVLAYFSAYMGASHEIFNIPLNKEFGPKEICTFRGVVIDSTSNEPLEAVIKQENLTRSWLSREFKNEHSQGYREFEGGAFYSILTETNKYKFTVEADGYRPYTFIADVTDMDEWTACERVIRMRKKGVLVNVKIVDYMDETVYVDAPLTVTDESGKKQDDVTKKGAGKHVATLEPRAKYTATAGAIEIDDAEYTETSEQIDLTNAKEGEEVSVIIRMSNIPDVQFDNVNFNTARPRSKANGELSVSITQISKSVETCNAVLAFLNDYPLARIRISAHTDSRGSDQSNMALSDRRAAAVKKYLVDKGIDPSRIEAKYFGETDPMVPNDSDNNMSLNRRVMFKVIK